MEEINKCLSCGKKLKLINMDWRNRKYHKACWKRKQDIEAGEAILIEYLLKEGMIYKTTNRKPIETYM
jgi:hypothetical protein